MKIGSSKARFLDNLGSYENDYTNISKLESAWAEDRESDYSFAIYVEGVGTQNGGNDLILDMATGNGLTGIPAKAEWALDQLIKGVKRLQNNKIDCIFIDTFGFSRGGAAARHVIHLILNVKRTSIIERLKNMDISVSTVQIKFVGLFDTVASFGIHHENDTIELNLDAVKYADSVVQLAAAEEHRKHFPLTNINSACRGLQIFLPGAHSDVGGGYIDNLNEDNIELFDLDRTFGLDEADIAAIEREKDWLIRMGWYHAAEISRINFWNELKATRKGISNKYSIIALQMMARFAGENGLSFKKHSLKNMKYQMI